MGLVHFDRRPFHELYETFRWQIPATYNIGVDVSDRWAGDADRLALIDVTDVGDTRYTFAALARASNRWANALDSLGIGRQDRVAIILPQCRETPLAHIATYKLGAVAVPLATLFGEDALEYRLRDSGARVAIFDEQTAHKIARIRDRLSDLRHLVVVGRIALDLRGTLDAAALEARASEQFTPIETRPQDPALIMYTSGTTGPPKGAVLPHSALIGHLPAFALFNNLAPQPGDLLWSPADWAWIGGLFNVLWAGWHYGIPVVAFRQPKFDPERAFWILDHYGIRNAFIFPTALKLMRQVPDPRARYRPRLRSVYSAGEPVGEELIAWGREVLGVTINEFFGQTEMNLVVGNCAEIMPVKPGSIGKPYPGHRVDVMDEEGRGLPPGELGEVAVRRPDPVMFLEYWNNPEATRRKFIGDWALMGDLALKDEEGYLWFKSRKDDIIKSGAYRIGPGEIEECLSRHPAVAMVAVVGVPDAERGQVVKAFIRLAPGHLPLPGLLADLQTLVKERVGFHAYPRSIEFVDELPLTTTGKMQRFVLRQRTAPQEGAGSGSTVSAQSGTQRGGGAMIDIARETQILSEEIPRAAGSYRRFAGTEADHRTIEHIASRFRTLGLETKVEWLQFMGWEPVSESLVVLAPERRTIACAPLTWAGSTPEGGVEGRLIYAGPTELVLFRWDRWRIVDADGEEIAYVIGITDDFPALPEPLDFPDINVPCVEFGKADNDLLHQWRNAGKEIRVNLTMQTTYKPQSRTANVIGRVPGTQKPETIIVVSGHHDSFSPGASDNASGVVSVLLLAERYRNRGYPYTIEFTSFGAEEWNLLGSRTHMEMQKQRGELARVKAVLNVDTVSHPEAKWIWMMVDEEDQAHLRRLTREALRELELDRKYEVQWEAAARGRYPGAGVDSAVYTHEGISALTVVWWPFPTMHQRSETRSNPEQVRVTVDIIDRVLQKLAADA